MKVRLLLFSLIVLTFASGCGGSGGGGGGTGGGGGEAPLGPDHRIFFANASLSGTTSVAPVSASFALGIHGIGGNFVRTTSSSPSFKMISGVGVD
jgi:hypothetical protein